MVSSVPVVSIDEVQKLKSGDLNDLCDAAEAAIRDGGGFGGWLMPPDRELMERYWRGVLLIPERILMVGRLDGVIAGSIQLLRPSRTNEVQAHACSITTAFVAPWGRGHGLAHMLTEAAEAKARDDGFRLINLDVRATQERAIAIYEALGYQRIGTHPYYARVHGQWVTGYYYYKLLSDASTGGLDTP